MHKNPAPYTLLTLKYGVIISTRTHKSLACLHSITTRTGTFVSEWEIICESRTHIRVTQWENKFTRCQSQSNSCAHFDAIHMMRTHLASLLHTSRSTQRRSFTLLADATWEYIYIIIIICDFHFQEWFLSSGV